ncbi:MAG: hypothetical protein ACI823_002168 [Chitinophagales bacterium]|jgi:hypothetical protein
MGMQTFDPALFHLYNKGKFSLDEALKNADGENNFRLRIELASKADGSHSGGDDSFGGLAWSKKRLTKKQTKGTTAFLIPNYPTISNHHKIAYC